MFDSPSSLRTPLCLCLLLLPAAIAHADQPEETPAKPLTKLVEQEPSSAAENPSQAADTPDPTAELIALRAAVTAADHAFNRATGQRDQEGFRSLLAKDIVFLAGELHSGRLQVQAVWQHLFDGKYDFRYSAETLDTVVARSGEFGWTIGKVQTSFTRPGLTVPDVIDGHYLNVWTQDDQGVWKLAYTGSLVVHASLGVARDPRSGLMTAWPELADQVDAHISIDWQPETTTRAASGEVAVSFGSYQASFQSPASLADAPANTDADTSGDTPEAEKPGAVAGKGHFLSVWQKDAQGRWQLAGEGFTPPDIYGSP